jgi:hypothetical protein
MNSSFLVTKVHKLDFFNKLHKLSYRVFSSIVLGSKMHPNSFALQQDIIPTLEKSLPDKEPY